MQVFLMFLQRLYRENGCYLIEKTLFAIIKRFWKGMERKEICANKKRQQGRQAGMRP